MDVTAAEIGGGKTAGVLRTAVGSRGLGRGRSARTTR